MKNLSFVFLLILISVFAIGQKSKTSNSVVGEGTYTMVVEGYDWGAAVSKVILYNDKPLSTVDKNNYAVWAERKTECVELKGAQASGERNILHAYVSNAKGDLSKEDKYITLVLGFSPNDAITNPLQYTQNDKCKGNVWVDYSLLVINKMTQKVWNKKSGRIIPLIDDFDLKGSFTHKDITMNYASYTPKAKSKKSPLIIWLHGGGEGGTDPTIPLIANKAANYASPEIQNYFGGAYVLVPQSPTFWMDSGKGEYTRGKVDDMYNEGLMALIKDYVSKHPSIDKDRIYLGGCSNGGYMSLKLILMYPDYFAAGYISALAYQTEYISDKQISAIKNVPIWFIHSKDDQVTNPTSTVLPLYKRLMKTGASNVHFSYYDHVVDLTGFYGGNNYHYNGHWSWVYSHVNHSTLDYDKKPVLLEGRSVTIMEWMAAQKK